MVKITEGIFNIGDLVQVIDIGAGTREWPWGDKKVVAIYLGIERTFSVFRYSLLKDLSEHHSNRNKSHVVWYQGRKRYISCDRDITLLAAASI
jgi:hypothetical protein